jgi:hypothetical protein
MTELFIDDLDLISVAREEEEGRELDSRALVPDVCRETRQALIDQIRGDKPTTVLGLLVSREQPLTVESIAGLLDKEVDEVEWAVDVLEEEALCARIFENNLMKVVAFAPYGPTGR